MQKRSSIRFSEIHVKTESFAEHLNDRDDEEQKCLAASAVPIHGTKLHVLMDTGATPSVMSSKLVKKRSLKPECTIRVVTVPAGDKSKAKRLIC